MENIVRKGEIACYKKFLLFSQCFPQLYISLARQNAPLCGNGLRRFHFSISHMILNMAAPRKIPQRRPRKLQ